MIHTFNLFDSSRLGSTDGRTYRITVALQMVSRGKNSELKVLSVMRKTYCSGFRTLTLQQLRRGCTSNGTHSVFFCWLKVTKLKDLWPKVTTAGSVTSPYLSLGIPHIERFCVNTITNFKQTSVKFDYNSLS